MLRPTTLGPLLVLVAAFVAIGGAPVSAEELVGDGGFGDGVGDWTTIDGELSLVPAAHSGSQAVQLSGAGAFDAEMFQLIPVADGETYEWSGWASADPQSISQGRLRVSWVGSSGSVTSLDEVTWQPWAADAYQHFSTGPRIAPPGTTAARVSVLVAAVSFPSSVLVDDVSFEGPRPAPPTPTMSPTETPTPPPPTAPPATTSPTPGGAPTASPSHAPTPTEAPPAPTAAPTPVSAPPATTAPTPAAAVVFSQLTNGDFEDDGAEGAPLGWRKIGGTMESVSSPVRSGSRALSLTSETTATKWAYQTVQVSAGQFYDGSAFARYTDAGVEAVFIRVS